MPKLSFLIADGPNLVPGRKLVVPSKPAPKITISASSYSASQAIKL